MTRFIACVGAVLCFLISGGTGQASGLPAIQTVFIILMENSDWAQIHFNASAPYLNQTLLPMASYCSQYMNVPGNHPSEPNYLWLESGTNFGIFNSLDPSANHQSTTNHLVTLLKNAGVSWKTYQEDISGTYVPLSNTNGFVPRHCPFVYFDDVTGTNNPNYPYGIAHVRPYAELAGDLAGNTVARYNFITPDLCDDMHDTCAPLNNNVMQGDQWLASEIPKITNSIAFQNNGAIFITWDENSGDNSSIGMIVLSPLAKGGGYQSTNYYTHSSTLRTFQEIFGVQPFLGDAANATDLSDLFVAPTNPPLPGFRLDSVAKTSTSPAVLNISGATPGKTNLLQCSSNLVSWNTIATNVAPTNNFAWTDLTATNVSQRYYRIIQLP